MFETTNQLINVRVCDDSMAEKEIDNSMAIPGTQLGGTSHI
jgi:hypothetical protein